MATVIKRNEGINQPSVSHRGVKEMSDRQVLWEGRYRFYNMSQEYKSLLVMENDVIFEELYYDSGTKNKFNLENFLISFESKRYTGPPLSKKAWRLINYQLAIEELKK